MAILRFFSKLSALLVAAGALLSAQQTVWFTPLPYAQQPVGYFGESDYMSLFSPTAPWQNAVSHVQVFKIYDVSYYTDAQLSTIITYLQQHNIALALEWPVLSSTTCGAGIEGFGGSFLSIAQRIQSLGGTLTYVAMQQPYEWGSLYSGTNACQWTAQQVAQNALATVNQAKTIFPNLQVGDISAIPSFPNVTNWPALYGSWMDTWRSVSGAPLAFFHLDVDWTEPNWQAAVAQIRPVVEQRGIPLGIVYNGFLTDESDTAWLTDAESHFVQYEVSNGFAPPEQVDFQTWNPNPTHALPETDPTAFTYLIDRYFRTRTQLTLNNNGVQASGKLTAGGAGVAGASVQITAQPTSGTGSIATYTLTGTVPNEAASALVGARVNTECYACNGPSDLTIFGFQYSDTKLAPYTWNFTNGLNGWLYGGPSIFDPGPAPYIQGLHITAQSGQAVVLNSTQTKVTPGSQFTLQVTARVSPESVGTGYFTLIWFDAAGNEPSREVLYLAPPAQTLATVTTASDGSFSIGNSVSSSSYQVTASYAGSSTLWPAASTPQPPPAIAAVVNAANFAKGPVAPGEIITIGGTAMGPATPAGLQLDQNGNVATNLGGVQVLFNGTPAPLTYVSPSQINAVVPYEMAGSVNPSVEVSFSGQTSNVYRLAPVPAVPALFTFNSSGSGPGAILNADGSYNEPTNPAPKGSIVVLYLTGEGQTSPAGVTGKVTTVASTGPLTPQPVLPVTVSINGQPATVAFYGEAPGLISGVMQVNVQIPPTAPSGNLPIVVSVGGYSTPAGVTVSVQ